MTSLRGTLWDGVQLWRLRAAPEPEARSRAVALPVSWDSEDASALAAIAPGAGPVLLPRLAEGWIAEVTARGRRCAILALSLIHI